MDISIQTKVKLNNGVEMPLFGIGVWQMSRGEETRSAVRFALGHGYRLIDTAKLYANEEDVGVAVRESGIPREEVFVTTKLWNGDHGYEAAIRAFNRSHAALDIGPIDLYLIHWPVPKLRGESWRAMTKVYEDGKCRAIGVSNYNIRHLEELLDTSDIVPAVNQVEFSPFLYQKDLLEFSRRHGIRLEAYSPLTKGIRLHEPSIVEIASKYQRTAAQLLIRWALQHEIVVIPKSSRPERILENARVFDFSITPSDMALLDSLHEDYRTAWDPTDGA